MASPQKENGYLSIATELVEQLVATPLPDNEHRMLLFIMRKTYGYHKKEDHISLTQFEKALKRSRPVIVKALKNLKARGMVVATPLLGISIEKDYEKWVVDTPLLVKNKSKYGSPAPTESGSPAPTHNRYKITKDTLQPTVARQVSVRSETNLLLDEFYKTINPLISFSNTTQRASADLLIKQFGFDEAIAITRYAISIQDNKYAPRITTPYQLKEKYAELKIYRDKSKS